jgi:ABC-type siderophore export system fused ATPase/permease subunit
MMAGVVQAAAALTSLDKDTKVVMIGDDVDPLQAAVLALGRTGVVLQVSVVALEVAVVAVTAVLRTAGRILADKGA